MFSFGFPKVSYGFPKVSYGILTFPNDPYRLLWAPAAAGINFGITVRNIAVGAIRERYSVVSYPLGWPGKTNNFNVFE